MLQIGNRVAFHSVDCKKHIFFSTKPWESVKEFQQIKDIWENYNNGGFHVLKTKDDYNLFNEYLEGHLS